MYSLVRDGLIAQMQSRCIGALVGPISPIIRILGSFTEKTGSTTNIEVPLLRTFFLT